MMLRRFFHSSVSQLNRIEAFDSLGWKENRTCAVAIFSREKIKKKSWLACRSTRYLSGRKIPGRVRN